MPNDESGGIASYYDNLSRFLDFARRLGRGGGIAQGSTHRFLSAVPGEPEDETSGPERLDQIVFESARATGLPAEPRMLDAGCGLGGTILYWQTQAGGSYVGLTLSAEQARRANAEAFRRGVHESARFYVRSYHDPIEGKFDAVVAIESLAHSRDPSAALRNFAAALPPGGLLIVVDDLPDARARRRLIDGFKSGWRCPVLLDSHGYRTVLEDAGLRIERDVDLTPRLRPRSLPWLYVLIVLFGLARLLAPTRNMRDVLGALLGGFYLEALYRTGGMNYRLMVAKA